MKRGWEVGTSVQRSGSKALLVSGLNLQSAEVLWGNGHVEFESEHCGVARPASKDRGLPYSIFETLNPIGFRV